MRNVTTIDASGVRVLEELASDAKGGGYVIIFSAVSRSVYRVMRASGFVETVGRNNFAADIFSAIKIARKHLEADEKGNVAMNAIIENYHSDALGSFRNYKKLAERAVEQISDEEFFAAIDDEANSIAVIIKHIAGNLRSRWSDFLTADGEKPDRDRDMEFEIAGDTRPNLMEYWEASWQSLFDAIDPLTADDFSKTITIRGEPHSIVEAINRQLTHYAYHIGQIVLLAKHFRSAEWKTLSVPKNRSSEFNQFLAEKQNEGVVQDESHGSGSGIYGRRQIKEAGPCPARPFNDQTASKLSASADANTADHSRARTSVGEMRRSNGFTIRVAADMPYPCTRYNAGAAVTSRADPYADLRCGHGRIRRRRFCLDRRNDKCHSSQHKRQC